MFAPTPRRRRLLPTVPARGESCCAGAGRGVLRPAGAPPLAGSVALIGCPNVGKSTLFNALTGGRRREGNWPGTSVDVGRAPWRALGVTLLDLPGALSLDPTSPDEELTRDLLASCCDGPAAVVVAVNAADLARDLYLVRQVRERERRVVLALTMVDVASAEGVEVSAEVLADRLGVPVVKVDARTGAGLPALADAVRTVLDATAPAPLAAPEGSTRLERADARFAWIAELLADAVHSPQRVRQRWGDRFDRVALGPWSGAALFLAVMWALFQVTTTVAAPLQGLLGDAVAGPVTRGADAVLGWMSLQDSWIRGLLVDGLVAGVGTVLTFVPMMALIFTALSLLEDSGYLARGAVVADRLMRAIGLPGRAFLPLMVGFGCNVPAVSATRVLPDARHRLLTVLLVPFTSCSARLTVYLLVATTFFGSRAGTVVFAMYVLSIVLVVLGGLLLRRTLLPGTPVEPLVLDLPRYQVPVPRVLVAQVRSRLGDFVRTAGGVIVVVTCAIWLLGAIPASTSARTPDGTAPARFAAVEPEHSAYGLTARALAPALEPAGFGNWHASGALVVGFVAKEAVVASWAQTYASSGQETGDAALEAHLVRDFDRSSGGHGRLAAFAFLAFMLAYTPCGATLAAQKREIGWRWTLIGVAGQLGIAWTLATAIFQVGRLFA